MPKLYALNCALACISAKSCSRTNFPTARRLSSPPDLKASPNRRHCWSVSVMEAVAPRIAATFIENGFPRSNIAQGGSRRSGCCLRRRTSCARPTPCSTASRPIEVRRRSPDRGLTRQAQGLLPAAAAQGSAPRPADRDRHASGALSMAPASVEVLIFASGNADEERCASGRKIEAVLFDDAILGQITESPRALFRTGREDACPPHGGGMRRHDAAHTVAGAGNSQGAREVEFPREPRTRWASGVKASHGHSSNSPSSSSRSTLQIVNTPFS